MSKKIKLDEIKLNPENPREIKDKAFRQLVRSLKEFPKMLELRPIVVNDDWVVLGGNHKLKGLRELGYTEVPKEWVRKASELTKEEQKEFIIKDNLNAGEFDFEALQDWDIDSLNDWGLEIEEKTEQEQFEEEFEDIGDEEAEYPIVPRFYEKYDAFVIYTENEIDANNLKGLLGLKTARAEKNDAVGQTHVISYKDFIEKWNAR